MCDEARTGSAKTVSGLVAQAQQGTSSMSMEEHIRGDIEAMEFRIKNLRHQREGLDLEIEGYERQIKEGRRRLESLKASNS